MAAGGQHDATSNCSTATCEQSGLTYSVKRFGPVQCKVCHEEFSCYQALAGHTKMHGSLKQKKDKLGQSKQVAEHKSGAFQCRVCHEKFSSHHAHNGHMKKHGSFIRRKDKLGQSKQVAEHKSASGLLGQNDSSALSKLSQAHLQRLSSEGYLEGGAICMGAPPSAAASAHREVSQPNLYNPSRSLPPSLHWNCVSIARAVPEFRLYRRQAPSDQGRQGYCLMLHSNTSSVEQWPCNTSYVEAMHLGMGSSDSDMPTADHRSNSLQSEQTGAEEESILAGPVDVETNLSLSNRGFVHQGASSLASTQSQQNMAAEECDDGNLTTKRRAEKRANSQ